MTFFLKDEPDGDVPMPEGWVDRAPTPLLPGIGAATSQMMRDTNASWLFEREMMGERSSLARQVWERMGKPDLGFQSAGRGARIDPLQTEIGQRSVIEKARRAAEAEPDNWADLDLTEEGLSKRVTQRQMGEDREEQALLDMMPRYQGLAEFTGGVIGSVADARQVPFLLLGGGAGSFLKTVGAEAFWGMASEAVTLPDQFETAERLDKPDPNVIEQLAFGAVGGGLLGGGAYGVGRGIEYWKGRQRLAVEPGDDPIRAEVAVDAAEEALQAGEDPLAAVQRAMDSLPDPAPNPFTTAGIDTTGLTILRNDDLPAVQTDAARFQFKAGGDEQGVTGRLKDVANWEPERAGVGLLWEDATGKRFVADGHQRLSLAKLLASKGQSVEMPVRILRELDGISAEQARARAALKNLAEGTGTPVDAAKVLRDLGGTARDLNLPPQSALIRTGEGLARLSDDAFGMVVNGLATDLHGGLVGRMVNDQDLQPSILSLLTRLKPANQSEAESIILQALESGATRETQASLFGDEVVASSLYLERARILDQATKQLRQDRTTFNTLLARSERITGAGNRLDAQANARQLQETGVLAQMVAAQANRKGKISDALTEAANEFKRTGKPGKPVSAFVEAVRVAIARGDLNSNGGRVGQPEIEPRTQISPPAVAEGFFGAMTPAGREPVTAEAAYSAILNRMVPDQSLHPLIKWQLAKARPATRAEAEQIVTTALRNEGPWSIGKVIAEKMRSGDNPDLSPSGPDPIADAFFDETARTESTDIQSFLPPHDEKTDLIFSDPYSPEAYRYQAQILRDSREWVQTKQPGETDESFLKSRVEGAVMLRELEQDEAFLTVLDACVPGR